MTKLAIDTNVPLPAPRGGPGGGHFGKYTEAAMDMGGGHSVGGLTRGQARAMCGALAGVYGFGASAWRTDGDGSVRIWRVA